MITLALLLLAFGAIVLICGVVGVIAQIAIPVAVIMVFIAAGMWLVDYFKGGGLKK